MSEEIVKDDYITEKDVATIVKKCGYTNNNVVIKSYDVSKASDLMLGFLAEYWKLKVNLIVNNNEPKALHFFIKAVSKSNAAKASMVKEWQLFQKETFFYSVIKSKLQLEDLKPWSAKLITTINDAIVFEDLTALNYMSRNKYERFDMAHTLEAINTLARFHASSIIYEENKSKILRKPYSINDEYSQFLDEGGYQKSSTWYIQCMKGALEAIKHFSKYANNNKIMNLIENCWEDVWFSALKLGDFSTEERSVVSHRDLWNNNILFQYKEVDGVVVVENCVLVDFQAVRCQPLTGDIMVLLYCNLDPTFREKHMDTFLNHYYKQLKTILYNHDIKIEEIINEQIFLNSAEKQRKWGLIICACLMPVFWIDDYETTNTFCDTNQFNKILTIDKGTFIKKNMDALEDYRNKVMEIFEEIIERYCINRNCE